jgi:hypothetical protein
MDDFSDLPSWQRYLILLGSGMTSSKRGLQQLANGAGLKKASLGTSDADMADIEFEQKASQKLSDATPGGWVAEAAGNLADPISLAAGGALGTAAKVGKSAVTLARQAALSGALTGGVSEVKDGGSRLGNMAFGAGTNAAMPVASGVKNIWAGGSAKLPAKQAEAFRALEDRALGQGGEPQQWIYKDGKLVSGPKNHLTYTDAEAQRIASEGGLTRGYIKDPTDADANPYRVWIDQSRTKMRPEAIADIHGAHEKWMSLPGMGGNDESYFSARVGDLMDAPDMFHAYPALADTPISIKFKKNSRHSASYMEDADHMTLDTGDLSDPKTMGHIIHELQHKVQAIENWPRGDNPDRLAQVIGPKAFHAYLGGMGEIEARDSAARALIDPKNARGFQYGALHADGPSAKAFENASLPFHAPLPAIGNDPAAVNPRLFHQMPMNTEALDTASMLDAVARGMSPDDFLRSLRSRFNPN